MKNITSSIYTFQDMIGNDFLYVDKTQYIWKMVQPGGGMYFLSRPRRFGKSLTVSTLKALFQGKKELFKGLAIYDKPYDWKPYPVIHLSFGDYGTVRDPLSELPDYLCAKVQQIAAEFSITLTQSLPGLCFGELIDALAHEGHVVILIDEYDKPILDNITHPQVQQLLKILKGFFSVIKDRNSKERFVFITGVSKFCHVSLFSDLNNLTDITMSRDFATMLGYTQEEFEAAFQQHIEKATQSLAIPRQQLLDEIKSWYNGYRFEDEAPTVYNPVSLAQFFSNNAEFKNYWFATGTPSFLIQLIKKTNFDLEQVLNDPMPGLAFEAFEVGNITPLALLLQTGYLTIKSSSSEFGETLYQLDFPNREVKDAFQTYLVSDCTTLPKTTVGTNVFKMLKAIKSRNITLFMELLKSFFAAVSYDVEVNAEARFQLLFYSIFLLIGVRIEAESRTNNGRIDAVICDGDHVFIFEFKINQSAEIALQQIRDKEYFQKYRHSNRKILLIGANFDTTTRQINDWKWETVED